jgi:hypothetical protein
LLKQNNAKRGEGEIYKFDQNVDIHSQPTSHHIIFETGNYTQ